MNPRTFTFVVAFLVLLTTNRGAANESLEPKTSAPNIVIIMVDDMGYGDPGCFNPNSKIQTPNIDRLAQNGMKFTDAHAPGPLCHISRYGLMTGQYPFRSEVKKWRQKPSIATDRVTIASLLKENNYQTAMVGKWHLGFDESKGYDNPMPGGPVDCGFETYFGIRASTDIPPYFYIRGNQAVAPPTNQIEANNSAGWSPIQGAFWRAGGIAPDLELADVLPKFTDEAIGVIKSHAETRKSTAENVDQPLMLYLAYPAPHTPWLPSPMFDGKSSVGMYGDFVMMVDAMIGKVLGELDSQGMAENTLVIFTSDNGPVWYDADVEKYGHDSCGELRGMKADAWEAGHRMPFIASWPAKIEKGSTSDQMICFTDLLATFAELVGKDLPENAGPDSVSFLPVLLGQQPESKPVREHLVIAAGGGLMMIREGNWKLINGLGSGGFSKPKSVKPEPGEPIAQLYDLSNDLSESRNIYAGQPEVAKRLTSKLLEIAGDAARPKQRQKTKQKASK